MTLSDAQAKLLSDGLNRSIIRTLVFQEASALEIAKKNRIDPVKTWRRLRKLEEAGLVEHKHTTQVGNLQKKWYRALATKYVTTEVFRYAPNDQRLQKAWRSYIEIQQEALENILKHNDIPADVDPIDYSLTLDIYTLCRTFLRSDIKEKLDATIATLRAEGLLEKFGIEK